MDKIILKNVVVLLSLLLTSTISQAQRDIKNDTLIVDLDFDKKADTVILDRANTIINCKLSTKKFVVIKSLKLDLDEPQAGIRKKGNGFTYFIPHMRSGYHCDFIYNKRLQKIQLIAIDRYEFGPANNDGSGESSINLLTNNYVGDWNYYDLENEELVKIATIKRKMVLQKTYLQNFDDDIVYKYINSCAKLFNTAKENMVAAEELSRLSTNSIVVNQIYNDAFGKNRLNVQVINPCQPDSSIFDGILTQITVTLKNKKTISYTYKYPYPQMALINFKKAEILVKDFKGKKAVFIPFYYCGGYETYDRKVSYILLFNNKIYNYHLDYYCKGAQNCNPVQNFDVLFKDLSPTIRPYFIRYLKSKHQSRQSFHQD